jgi:multidrug efflux pump subunit AcrA (membrane-fusion protein)
MAPRHNCAVSPRSAFSWPTVLLALLCIGAAVAAVLVVGPASGSSTAALRTARVARGVVQSTVSGTGNLAPLSQFNLGFKTSGTVASIDVAVGEHVVEGRLLATLDPQSAEATLEQARAALLAAEANLAGEEETGGEPSSSGTSPSNSNSKSKSTSAKPALSAATREANLASARAAVKSDALTVRGDEEAVADTELVAPSDGTIVSLNGSVGEVVSGGGTTRASSAASSSSSGASGASGAGASGAGRSAAGSSGSSGASGSSGTSGSTGTAFAVLSDLSSFQLVVPLSESEISSVRVGQIATVTVEALGGRKLAAHVSEIALLSTTSSGVVSYDVTFLLDQMEPGLRPGMSATAEVVVHQAEGVNVPTTAISGGSVTVLSNGSQVRRRVVTGLAGDSSTIILSGLAAGETVVLPAAATSSSRTSSTGRGVGPVGGGLGGGGGFPGGGAALFFRGGG